MNAHMGRLLAVLTLGLISGCAGIKGQPFDPGLVDRDFYLCCNTGFNAEFAASDANYGRYLSSGQSYASGPLLAAGTPVRVTKVGASAVAFQPLDSSATYTIYFGYGTKQQSASQYFHGVLRDKSPLDAMQNAPRSIADAVREGRLVPGMTKEQALMARGYPPAHRTPSVDANDWIYYDTPGFVDRVMFTDGTIQSVTRGPAPQ